MGIFEQLTEKISFLEKKYMTLEKKISEIPQTKAEQKPVRFNQSKAAKYLGISSATLSRYVTANKVKAYKQGRQVFFNVDELEHFKTQTFDISYKAEEN